MSKKNNDFFKKKKDWSMVKDELLGCYFQPYVSKILLTYRPLLYVDCFAGKGKFDDGNSGSPIIALDIINKGLEQTNATSSKVETCFIELNHAKELEHNLSGYPDTTIISGKYEDEIEKILSKKNDYNVFLYIDPYGIKALQCSLFDDFSKGQFNSIELLINMNSFGFIREACRAFGIAYNDVSVFDDLIEYDTTKLDSSDKSIDELNEIAGGDYWQNIITQYKNKMIDGYQAEDLFAKSYCDRLKQSYKYVLNMPLRIKKGQRPKYRMREKTRQDIIQVKSEIDGIYTQNQDAIALKDLNSRRAKVVGRISLWLESVEQHDDSTGKEKVIKKIEDRICEINETLDKDSLENRKQSVLSRISVDMTEWAKELNLEHSDNPYRLDMNKVTVIVDKADRPVPLKQLGSGSNWVGIHLITYFALHKYFITLKRPVPNFIFLDQPSQVYFPSELDEKNTDWNMVGTLYNFISDRVSELKQKLQVIIVDHANLKNESFRNSVIEDWWNENNLIPEDWYKK